MFEMVIGDYVVTTEFKEFLKNSRTSDLA